jgi:D-alanyl-D-alanine carboxypeptidase
LADEPPAAGLEVAEAAPLATPEPGGLAMAALVDAPEAPRSRTVDPLPNPEGLTLAAASVMPAPRPEPVIRPEPDAPEIVTRMSTSNGRLAGVTLGRFNTRDQAERTLITISLSDMSTFGTATRKIVQRGGAFEANFMGMSSDEAAFACQRVTARGRDCSVIGG